AAGLSARSRGSARSALCSPAKLRGRYRPVSFEKAIGVKSRVVNRQALGRYRVARPTEKAAANHGGFLTEESTASRALELRGVSFVGIVRIRIVGVFGVRQLIAKARDLSIETRVLFAQFGNRFAGHVVHSS